jgi:N-acetyl-gamma-glutamyl-phosphate reductase common form
MSRVASTSRAIPALVLGGSGYVAGELLRLLAGHPEFRLAGVLSDSKPGEPVSQSFPHLASAYPSELFCSLEQAQQLVEHAAPLAIFSAAPHGASAGLIDALLRRSEEARASAPGTAPRAAVGAAADPSAARNGNVNVHVVDISADFRYASAAAYESVYRHAHGAAARIASFTCAVPEHLAQSPTPHVAHPGCFATATLLASVPLLALRLVEPELFVAAITGSTGSGRKAVDGTHHPLRHSDLYTYNALGHRHTPEIVACALAASGVQARYAFVPHSGPFARGIHATVQARLARPCDSAQLLEALREYYAGAPFVQVRESAPRVKEVAASNYAQLSAVSDGRSVAVMCVIDNLTKGAAGGAVQWMNRLYGLPETTGLTAPAAGWT